ncbi:TonB-dependent receptor [Flaviaesturariibacter flavus]|uniref:TonB-dependent receptor n=1 Tax=Flaviaesturariibacter flavus TaxID=2502780 RepID=A0A4R1BPB5_9BACT|nr:TonB-dependent receptor [Flaviaesturariibacter flavus]TCJ19167.1 TonB-dependent receptor [Flaviaesturariibacter flavus]
MRKTLLFALLLLLAGGGLRAQFRVTGSLSDTVGHKAPELASIVVLQKKDSSLVTFTRSDVEGHFRTAPIAPGHYVVLITYPKFADLADAITVTDKDVDLGRLALTPKSVLLNEVIVRANAAIRIKGDTTEFAADSFKTREGATVEELLKRLPGFSVNAKGEITTQGKRVDKVLVDGEEFFGDDPTMATQNLSAKIVDKVQVYDTKTEQQNLTSIGGGNEGKTLNIKLKEDKKKGGFGKLEAGTDFTNFLEAKGLYNKFVGKKKLSAYATRSNVNTGSLSWNDKQKLGMENDMEYDEISGYYYSFGGGDDGFNDWNTRGLPDSYTGGGLFSNKWNNDRHNVNLSYRFNQLTAVNNNLLIQQNIDSGSRTFRNIAEETYVRNRQHAGNGKYEFKPDSLTTITYKINGLYKNTEQWAGTSSNFLRNIGDTANISEQTRNQHSTRQQVDQQLVWKQLFRKKNRMLITTARYGMTDDDQERTNRSDLEYFTNNIVDSARTIDQMRKVDGKSRTFGIKSTFNEPLSDKLNLVFEYGYNQNNSESFRNTFNKDISGKYESLDRNYSSNFDLRVRAHNGSTVLRYMYKKLRFALGTGVSGVQLKLNDLFTGNENTYNFFNVTPQVQFGYMPKAQMNFNFSYRGNTRQPTIDQLQPIRDNNDPLKVFTGNPDLKVGFVHSFNAGFNQYKALKGSWIGMNVGMNLTQNAIAMQNFIDKAGKQTYQPVNVNGNRDFWFWSSWSVGNGDRKWSKGLQLNGNGGRNNNFLNGRANRNDYTTFKFGPSLGYSWDQHYNVYFNPEVGYNTSRSALNPQSKTNYFTFGGQMNGSVNITKKLEFGADAVIEVRQKVAGFAGTPDNYMVNARLSYKVLKNNAGKISLTVNDLLDQNIGFNRNINSNQILEERYSRIARYFMLRFEWSFSKMPGAN